MGIGEMDLWLKCLPCKHEDWIWFNNPCDGKLRVMRMASNSVLRVRPGIPRSNQLVRWAPSVSSRFIERSYLIEKGRRAIGEDFQHQPRVSTGTHIYVCPHTMLLPHMSKHAHDMHAYHTQTYEKENNHINKQAHVGTKQQLSSLASCAPCGVGLEEYSGHVWTCWWISEHGLLRKVLEPGICLHGNCSIIPPTSGNNDSFIHLLKIP